ncbi:MULTISPECIES: hypothetical protein [unclassified Paenibacillus]|uniref:hypothetical protein n=1 Tax=unclassified Paenibacillus TaxID=185978 RepID=UPI0009A87470|nr:MULTISPECIES: hypothetical protein [unclassified Paenibacillus]SLK01750.1 hypothetical protein SAMN06272722_103124 [Paenibacillus sp. RU5A]SOC68812.1 hypothetical protein SAMN05880581_103124 [Paenibacillus sp. RU26A]SOC71259.1 hypothetical protein SAMN05880586_103124 [Paenibacillus sp. RU5M]
MRLYTNNIWKWSTTLLYPLLIFLDRSWTGQPHPWFALTIAIVFCFLWSGVKELFISTGLTWFVAIPCWWYFIELPKPSFGAENFAAHLWLIVLIFIFVVLLPQTLILTTRMRIMEYYRQNGK